MLLRCRDTGRAAAPYGTDRGSAPPGRAVVRRAPSRSAHRGRTASLGHGRPVRRVPERTHRAPPPRRRGIRWPTVVGWLGDLRAHAARRRPLERRTRRRRPAGRVAGGARRRRPGRALRGVADRGGVGRRPAREPDEGAAGAGVAGAVYSSTDAYWPVTPVSCRTTCGCPVTSTPKISARPSSMRSSVASIRSMVVLPAPFGPSTPAISPARTSRSIPSTARCSPKHFTRPSVRTAVRVPERGSRTGDVRTVVMAGIVRSAGCTAASRRIRAGRARETDVARRDGRERVPGLGGGVAWPSDPWAAGGAAHTVTRGGRRPGATTWSPIAG